MLENDRLQAERERLQQEIERLRRELELARRAGKRQAAPFSRGVPKAHPKRPGRKAGSEHGRHGHRPILSRVDETRIVPLPRSCPGCGGACTQEEWADQYQTEIVRQTRVTRFRVAVDRCRQCGSRVQGRDPRQTSQALGAAASQLGPQALSLATVLNKQLGLPFAKTAAVLAQGFGLEVTRGALSQALAWDQFVLHFIIGALSDEDNVDRFCVLGNYVPAGTCQACDSRPGLFLHE